MSDFRPEFYSGTRGSNNIVNKPVDTSYLSVGGGSAAMTSGKQNEGGTQSLEHWHEMEFRLQYIHAGASRGGPRRGGKKTRKEDAKMKEKKSYLFTKTRNFCTPFVLSSIYNKTLDVPKNHRHTK